MDPLMELLKQEGIAVRAPEPPARPVRPASSAPRRAASTPKGRGPVNLSGPLSARSWDGRPVPLAAYQRGLAARRKKQAELASVAANMSTEELTRALDAAEAEGRKGWA